MHTSLARRLGASAVVAAFGLGSLMTFGLSGASAHNGTAHPAHIHTGSCPTPGDVVFPLTDLAAATGTKVGTSEPTEVDQSDTVVQSTLADLVSTEHSIVVHESAENIGNYLACGNIAGPMTSDTMLVIGLAPVNDSGANGIAVLTDKGDGTTDVAVYLTEEEEGEYGTPEGSPADMSGMDMGTPAANSDSSGVTVDIKDFSFGDAVSVPVGTTVTFTNQDTVPHTVTDNNGSFQSDSIAAGASWSYTFATAGTYTYHCEFHANMVGTITVQ